jgi:hypothetical protein
MSTLQVNTIRHNTTGFNNVITHADGAGTANAVHARAWVNFNGSGTVAIRAQFNVNSITDNNTGAYTINFANAMPDVNYSWSLNGGAVYNGSVFCMIDATTGGNDATNGVATGSLGMEVRGNGGNYSTFDSDWVTASIFR